MFNKKGDIGYVTYLVPALMLLTIIFITFYIVFFVLGFGESNTPQTTVADQYSNIKLLNLLRSEIIQEGNVILVADYLEIANENTNGELIKLVESIPKPEFSNWHFEASTNDNKFIDIGESEDTVYFVQEINIPTKLGNVINSKLFLNCFGCSKKELEEVS